MKTKTFMPIVLTVLVVGMLIVFGFSRVAHAAPIASDVYAGQGVVNPALIGSTGYEANTTVPHEVDTNATPYGFGYIDRLPYYAPTLYTQNASRVTANSAQLNANYHHGSEFVTTTVSFEYGTSRNNMQYGTSPESLSIFSDNLHTRAIAGLSPNTTYYYRAIGYADGVRLVGETKSFTTGALGTTVSSDNTSGSGQSGASSVNNNNSSSGSSNNQNTGNSSTGSSSNSGSSNSSSSNTSGSASTSSSTGTAVSTYARLSITDNATRIERNDRVTYTVTYEAREAIKNATLSVELPDGVTIQRTSRGEVDKGDSRVTLAIGDIAAGSSRTITIDARATGSHRDGQSLSSTARLSFETSGGSARSLTARDTTEFIGGSSGLGASIFGSGVSLSFFNWIIVAGIIAAIIIIARKQFHKG